MLNATRQSGLATEQIPVQGASAPTNARLLFLDILLCSFDKPINLRKTIHLSKLFILLLLSILWPILNFATNIQSEILKPSGLRGVRVDQRAEENVSQLCVCDCTAQTSDGTFYALAEDLVLGDTGADAENAVDGTTGTEDAQDFVP